MARRVFISPNACRVSKSGYDAQFDSNVDHMLFDAFAWKSQGCFMKGAINSSNFALSSSSWLGNVYYIDIMYGKTFSTTPKIHWGVIDPQTNGFMASYQGLTQFGTQVVGAGSRTDRMTFWSVTAGSPPMSGSYWLVYFIFQV